MLSPSTLPIDQREKVLACKRLPSLLAYLIVHQAHREADATLVIPCHNIDLTLDELYEDVTFSQS